MLYGSHYCLFSAARSGEAVASLSLPKSEIPGSVYTSDSQSFLLAEFYVWAEEESEHFCTPTNLAYPEVYSVYLRKLHTKRGPLTFSKNLRYLEEENSFILGTKVGELVYDGNGHWVGELQHPNTDYNSGSVWVSLSLRYCFPATIFTGRFGSDPNNLTHQIQQPPTAIRGGQEPSTMILGGVWWDDECGTTLADDTYTDFPSWYYSIPNKYDLSNGVTIQTGWDRIPALSCRLYSDGFFDGYSDFGHSILTPRTCSVGKVINDIDMGSFDPYFWIFNADMTDRCTVEDQEISWVTMTHNYSSITGVAVNVGFGRPVVGVTLADAETFYGSPRIYSLYVQTSYRIYMPVSPLIPDGGFDWLDDNVLLRQPVTVYFFNGSPLDSQLEEAYFSVVPESMTISPVTT